MATTARGPACFFIQLGMDTWRIVSSKGHTIGWIKELVDDKEYELNWMLPSASIASRLKAGWKTKKHRTYVVRKTLTEVQNQALRNARRMGY